jgi:hypothetical protein
VTQVDGGSAGAGAAAVGREAVVAGRVAGAIEAGTGPGDLLDHVADGALPGAFYFLAVEHAHRHLSFDLRLLDARPVTVIESRVVVSAGALCWRLRVPAAQQAQLHGAH